MKRTITHLLLLVLLCSGVSFVAYGQDTEPPTIPNKELTALPLSLESSDTDYLPHKTLLLSWQEAEDKATPPSDLRYFLHIKESGQNWSQALWYVVKGGNRHIFNHLRADTEYHIVVKVRDNADNVAEYDPVTVSTRKEDLEPPRINSKTVTVEGEELRRSGGHGILFQLEEATDDATLPSQLLYTVRYRHAAMEEGEWHMMSNSYHAAKSGVVITAEKFTPHKEYRIEIAVSDQLHRVTEYEAFDYLFPDLIPPVVDDPTLLSSELLGDRVTLSWEPATDAFTPQTDMRYRVFHQKIGEAPRYSDLLSNAAPYTIHHLNPNTGYDLWVEAYDEFMNVASYDRLFVKTPIVLPEVITDFVENISGSGATLAGVVLNDGGSEITRYEFGCNPSDNPAGFTTVAATVNGSRFTAELTGLAPDTEYEFVTIVTSEKGTITGEKSLFTTLANEDYFAPGIANPALTLVPSSTSIALSWEKATDNVTKEEELRYRVEAIQGHTLAYSGELTKDIDSYTLSALAPDQLYRIRLYVYDEADNRRMYSEGEVRTTGSNLSPKKTNSSLRITDLTPTTIELSWEQATDDFTPQEKLKYSPYIVSYANNEKYIAGELYGASRIYIMHLNPGEKYMVGMDVEDEWGKSATYFPEVVTMPLPVADNEMPKATGGLLFSDIGATEITVSWEYATDDQTDSEEIVYILTWSGDGGNRQATIRGDNSYRVTDLRMATEYTFTLQAIDQAGNANNSHPAWRDRATTSDPGDIIPPTVSHPEVTTLANDHYSITLSWTKGSDETTPKERLLYHLFWIRADNKGKLEVATDLIDVDSYTVTLLDPDTDYGFLLHVVDEAGNVTPYHLALAKTPPAPVIVHPTHVTINPPQLSLEVGETKGVVATVYPANATDKSVSWKSDNPAVATVSSSGEVTALAEGTALITATTTDGELTANCEVTVTDSSGIGELSGQEVEVYLVADLLHVAGPMREQIELFGIAGRSLRRMEKPIGEVQLYLGDMPQGLLMVRGSSGWVKKVIYIKR